MCWGRRGSHGFTCCRRTVASQLQGGVDTTHPVGTLSIDNDFLLFDALGRRRLSFTATAESDVASKRLLAEQQVDQRTNGGSAHMEFDFFREWHGYLLRDDSTSLRESLPLAPAD